MNRVRITLLDDHLLFREGLSRLLAEEPDFDIIAQCTTVAEGIQAIQSGPAADLILLDFDLGEQNAFEFLELAQASGFSGKILMVTAGMSPSDTVRALRAGAVGFFLKHAAPTELVRSIRKAVRGEPLMSAQEAAHLAGAAQREEARRPAPLSLLERERAVLRGVFSGLANKEIAAKMGISEGYVKAVLQQLFAKTGVRTRAQLVRIALEHHFDTGE
jgi:DNA-binding NarL/FixJ family response regulator